MLWIKGLMVLSLFLELVIPYDIRLNDPDIRSKISEVVDGERVKLTGFVVLGDGGFARIAAVPSLRSCCVHKAGAPFSLMSDIPFTSESTGKLISIEGVIEGDLERGFSLREGKVLLQKSKIPTLSLMVIGGGVFFVYGYRRRSRKHRE